MKSCSSAKRSLFAACLERALGRVESDADAKGQTLTVTGASDVTLSADPYRLEQILANYLSNAVKFTPLGGQIEVRLSADAGELRCEVVDSGSGIAADDLPHIFQPFFQVDALQSRSHSGAGLGLALAKRLTELHGGRVWVESEVGRGSRLRFCPRSRAAAASHGSERITRQGQRPEPS